MFFYAVNRGRNPGVYASWAQCASQVNGFPNAVYKKFRSLAEAEQFVALNPQADGVSLSSYVPPSVAPSRHIIAVDSGEWATVYCEAYQCEDGNVGLGVWWDESHPKNLSERCPGLESLGRGELVAVVRAFENLTPGNSSLLVKTTSVRCIHYIERCVQIMMVEGEAEGVTLLDMPLSVYIPRLLARMRRRGRRIRFQHLREQEYGTQKARTLAMRGAEQESSKRVWTLEDEPKDIIHQTSLGSLEIEM